MSGSAACILTTTFEREHGRAHIVVKVESPDVRAVALQVSRDDGTTWFPVRGCEYVDRWGDENRMGMMDYEAVPNSLYRVLSYEEQEGLRYPAQNYSTPVALRDNV